jgi:hypothetical protein
MSSIRSIVDTIFIVAIVVIVIAVTLLVISIIVMNVHAKNVTVSVLINEQSILENQYLEDGRNNVNDAWFTINEERYRNGSYYDMSDWVWPDGSNEFNTSPLNDTLILPEWENQLKICFEDKWEYKSCHFVYANGTIGTVGFPVTFLYPR